MHPFVSPGSGPVQISLCIPYELPSNISNVNAVTIITPLIKSMLLKYQYNISSNMPHNNVMPSPQIVYIE
jgi:hypothetical protein